MIGKVISKYGLVLMIISGFWFLQFQLTDYLPWWQGIVAGIMAIVGAHMFIFCGNGKVEK